MADGTKLKKHDIKRIGKKMMSDRALNDMRGWISENDFKTAA